MKLLAQRRKELAAQLARMTEEELYIQVRDQAAHKVTQRLAEGNVRLQTGRFSINSRLKQASA
ncbi:hypothetical protein H0920_07675 [Acinetobacter sp. C_4_1]|uniref:hypothetical protein n=1 Tax=unclassified Acinetobacter TaxID=196816 RepID=UPI0021B71126|nr:MULTISPECIES: hypothetical protein [unclassified Acinetobacter]MCT8089342.1 hypothetical protein [Acinetobacter sp. F_3_1]MCT8096585.1 hypothetical protein [Acinetobacter sp. C_3_1]MCT8100977.1 hypothetical protein [Acinetobacter sp. C_4_1]MCT8134708.1 hypothetical protein [Acinetobacter sp. T_3_1]